MTKARLLSDLSVALRTLYQQGLPSMFSPPDILPDIQVVRRYTGTDQHCLATNLALTLASRCNLTPLALAKALVGALPEQPWVSEVSIEGPGFINFRESQAARTEIITDVLTAADRFGHHSTGAGQWVCLYMMSDRKSVHGPLVNARCHAIASSLAAVLRTQAYQVTLEKLQPAVSERTGVEPRFMFNGSEALVCCVGNVADNPSADVVGKHASSQPVSRGGSIASSHASSHADIQFIAPAQLSTGHHYAHELSPHSLPTSWPDLIDEIGKDAARYFLVMRHYSQPMTIDIALACRDNEENPLYRVRYAVARVASLVRRCRRQGLEFDQRAGLAALTRLTDNTEQLLTARLAIWPDTLEAAALAREPHRITNDLRDLANALHTYYSSFSIRIDDAELLHARLCLLLAVKQVLVNGLNLIDVSAPEIV